MLINIKRSGLWAFKGIFVEELKEGLQEMIDDRAKELLDNGRAELPEEEPTMQDLVEKAVELTKDVILDDEAELTNAVTGPIVDTVEKGKAGWWSVKFEEVEKVVKVNGADDEMEAIKLAIAKLEVQ